MVPGRNLSSSRSAPNAPKIRTNLPLDIQILKPLDFLYSSKADSIVQLCSSSFYRSPKASFPPTNEQQSNTPPKEVIKMPSRFTSSLFGNVKACIGPRITKDSFLNPVQRHDCLPPRRGTAATTRDGTGGFLLTCWILRSRLASVHRESGSDKIRFPDLRYELRTLKSGTDASYSSVGEPRN